MRSESLNLLASFASLMLIPIAIAIAALAISSLRSQKKWPSLKDTLQASGIAAGITLAITLAICVGFKLSGFFDAQFYRPSNKDYGQVAELELTPAPVTFSSDDGTKLSGWWLAAENPIGTVLHFHGSDRNITYTVKNASWMTDFGYNVFVFDYRGYGTSEGTPDRDGLLADSLAAIDYVKSRADGTPNALVLYGQSMGGQLAIVAAAQRRDSGIQVVVSEATYSRHSMHIADKLGQLGPLWLVKWGAWLLTSDQHCAEGAIAQVQCPVLLIHSEADAGVLPYHARRLKAAGGDNVDLWQLEDYRHLKIFGELDNRQTLANRIAELIP
ncbi:MAG TPA: hypothetical protein DDW52_13515 [Planctomycetaceae bacterium]|nr:hypothetical protein [Planctomycetaceae bacterium]